MKEETISKNNECTGLILLKNLFQELGVSYLHYQIQPKTFGIWVLGIFSFGIWVLVLSRREYIPIAGCSTLRNRFHFRN
jgi:hypothetical protein